MLIKAFCVSAPLCCEMPSRELVTPNALDGGNCVIASYNKGLASVSQQPGGRIAVSLGDDARLKYLEARDVELEC